MAVVRHLINAVSIGRVVSAGNTGFGSSDPGTGSFHVFSISSNFLRVWLLTRLYASRKICLKFRPRNIVYGVPTFLAIESRTYNGYSFLSGAVYSKISINQYTFRETQQISIARLG